MWYNYFQQYCQNTGLSTPNVCIATYVHAATLVYVCVCVCVCVCLVRILYRFVDIREQIVATHGGLE